MDEELYFTDMSKFIDHIQRFIDSKHGIDSAYVDYLSALLMYYKAAVAISIKVNSKHDSIERSEMEMVCACKALSMHGID